MLMATYGEVIGLPFTLEGFAFLIEAIFVGIYLYAWDRRPPRVHLLTSEGVPLHLGGIHVDGELRYSRAVAAHPVVIQTAFAVCAVGLLILPPSLLWMFALFQRDRVRPAGSAGRRPRPRPRPPAG